MISPIAQPANISHDSMAFHKGGGAAGGGWPGGRLYRLFRHWKARRRGLRSRNAEPYILDDTGVTSVPVEWDRIVPPTVDSGTMPEERGFERRRRAFMKQNRHPGFLYL